MPSMSKWVGKSVRHRAGGRRRAHPATAPCHPDRAAHDEFFRILLDARTLRPWT